MPKRRDLLPGHQELLRRASLSDFVDGCVKTFAQGAELHVALNDSTSPAEKRKDGSGAGAVFSPTKRFFNSFSTVFQRIGYSTGACRSGSVSPQPA